MYEREDTEERIIFASYKISEREFSEGVVYG